MLEEYELLNDELEKRNEELNKEIERLNNKVEELMELYTTERHCKDDYKAIIKEVREKINNFDVFKEFTFPLMKRDVEQQVKSSIDYEWRKSIKEPILEILDKGDK